MDNELSISPSILESDEVPLNIPILAALVCKVTNF